MPKRIRKKSAFSYYRDRNTGELVYVSEEGVKHILKSAAVALPHNGFSSLPVPANQGSVQKTPAFPVDQGPEAARKAFVGKMWDRGVTVDSLIDSLEGARNACKDIAGLLPDHRSRLRATEIYLTILKVLNVKSGDDTASPIGALLGAAIVSEARAASPVFDMADALSNLLHRAQAITAGARTDSEISRYVASSPKPVIPSSYIDNRVEAERILETFVPELFVQKADEDEFANVTVDKEGEEVIE